MTRLVATLGLNPLPILASAALHEATEVLLLTGAEPTADSPIDIDPAAHSTAMRTMIQLLADRQARRGRSATVRTLVLPSHDDPRTIGQFLDAHVTDDDLRSVELDITGATKALDVGLARRWRRVNGTAGPSDCWYLATSGSHVTVRGIHHGEARRVDTGDLDLGLDGFSLAALHGLPMLAGGQKNSFEKEVFEWLVAELGAGWQVSWDLTRKVSDSSSDAAQLDIVATHGVFAVFVECKGGRSTLEELPKAAMKVASMATRFGGERAVSAVIAGSRKASTIFSTTTGRFENSTISGGVLDGVCCAGNTPVFGAEQWEAKAPILEFIRGSATGTWPKVRPT